MNLKEKYWLSLIMQKGQKPTVMHVLKYSMKQKVTAISLKRIKYIFSGQQPSSYRTRSRRGAPCSKGSTTQTLHLPASWHQCWRLECDGKGRQSDKQDLKERNKPFSMLRGKDSKIQKGLQGMNKQQAIR